MSKSKNTLPTRSSATEVDEFLAKLAANPPPAKAGSRRGRLIFAMDATASREPSWDHACHIQAEMFQETNALGGLDIQLCYYRGYHEFDASVWLNNAVDLHTFMSAVHCVGGLTQLQRILKHAAAQSTQQKINALVFVGDCMEEDVDAVCHQAGRLGIMGVPCFMFHEGYDAQAERTFREVATLSRGAYCRFDTSSAQQLKDLLRAVAVYAAGGAQALEDFGKRNGGIIQRLSHQIQK